MAGHWTLSKLRILKQIQNQQFHHDTSLLHHLVKAKAPRVDAICFHVNINSQQVSQGKFLGNIARGVLNEDLSSNFKLW